MTVSQNIPSSITYQKNGIEGLFIGKWELKQTVGFADGVTLGDIN